MTVEAKKGRVLPFAETEKGIYRLLPQFVDQQDQYRVRIKTRTGQTYLSDYYTTVISPAIDSITYSVEGNSEGITLKVSTRNRPDAERFYRWYYDETWEYVSALRSEFEVINYGTPEATIVPRTDNIYNCWKSDKSRKIMIASTAKQSENLLLEHSLNYVPTVSRKLVVKYSMLLHQHAISRDAFFEYWTALRKTTETTGSIFDPVPSSVTGNIKNTENSEEPVFGFFTSCIPSEKRFFLPEQFGMAVTCADTVVTEPQALKMTDSLIVRQISAPNGNVYRASHISCIDCRFYRGTNVRPSFWE